MKDSKIEDSLNVLFPTYQKPVSFSEFAVSPDYANMYDLYPYWQKVGDSLKDPEELILDGSLGGGKCQVGDTVVLTDRGLRRLKDLVTVRSVDGTNPLTLRSFSENLLERFGSGYYSGFRDTKKLKLSDGTRLECSLHHKYKVWNVNKGRFDWKAASNIEVGDLLKVDLTTLVNLFDSALSNKRDEKFFNILGEWLFFTYFSSHSYYERSSTDDRLFIWAKKKGIHFLDQHSKKIYYFDILKEILGDIPSVDNVINYLYNATYDIQCGFVRALLHNWLEVNDSENIKQIDVKRYVRQYGLKFTQDILLFTKYILNAWGVHSNISESLLVLEEPARTTNNPDFALVSVKEIKDGNAELFDVNVPGSHAYRANGITSHNTTFGIVYSLYRIYKLLTIPNLFEYLKISQVSELHVLYFNVSLASAKRSGFGVMRRLIDRSPWFQKYAPRDKKIDSEIRLSRGISIIPASNDNHQISLNVIGFLLDESNFRNGVGTGIVEQYEDVARLYSQLIDRQITRFMRKDGSEAFAILVSSASFQTSFTEKRKAIVSNNPRAAIVTSVNYKIHPENYSKETFTAFIGTSTISPQFVENEKEKETLIRRMGFNSLEDLPEVYSKYFIEVPETLRSVFLTNFNLGLQNHAGIPTQVEGRFVTNLEIIRSSYRANPSGWFDGISYELSNLDDIELEEFVNVENIQFPERPHSFFFDLSLTGDPGGFSCVRNDSTAKVRKHTHIFTLSINPPAPPGETRISKIFNFMQFIGGHVDIQAFGTDNFQSKYLRQEVAEMLNLEDIRLSIDSSDQFHLHWMKGLVDGSFDMLYIRELHQEIESAMHDLKRRRVVKPAGGSDDLFQSLVGAYFLSDVYTENTSYIFEKKSDYNVVSSSQIIKMLHKLGYR
jgi:hypothetical protein